MWRGMRVAVSRRVVHGCCDARVAVCATALPLGRCTGTAPVHSHMHGVARCRGMCRGRLCGCRRCHLCGCATEHCGLCAGPATRPPPLVVLAPAAGQSAERETDRERRVEWAQSRSGRRGPPWPCLHTRASSPDAAAVAQAPGPGGTGPVTGRRVRPRGPARPTRHPYVSTPLYAVSCKVNKCNCKLRNPQRICCGQWPVRHQLAL